MAVSKMTETRCIGIAVCRKGRAYNTTCTNNPIPTSFVVSDILLIDYALRILRNNNVIVYEQKDL